MKKLSIILVALVATLTAAAQQQQQYSLFQFTKQGINPGYVGSTGLLSVGLDYRNQWVNQTGAPETFSAGVHGLIGNRGSKLSPHGAGIFFYTDKVGATTTNNVALQYAYRLRVGETTTLALGVQGSITNTGTDFRSLRAFDAGDPTAAGATASNTLNLGAGLYLYSNRFFAGLSAPLLLDNKTDLDNNVATVKYVRQYNAMAGYLQPVNDILKLRLNVLARVSETETSYTDGPAIADFNLAGILFDRFLIGASYRTDNTVLAMAQVQLNRYLNVGYSLDLKTGKIGNAAGVSHEIYLGFNLPSSGASFTTPRFISYF